MARTPIKVIASPKTNTMALVTISPMDFTGWSVIKLNAITADPMNASTIPIVNEISKPTIDDIFTPIMNIIQNNRMSI
ncbi:MAG TPA: hypothetical protein PLD14_02920 [Candidatus Pacearchaeota archaeon]|nr:hypothetical protein [Candidatus Pacearchaeota archaeon]HPR80152.1 hypothetical protein [Candidatus Pacearchaeota archaeon]